MNFGAIDIPIFDSSKMEAYAEQMGRMVALENERIVEAMAHKFLGPRCPKDAADVATVLIAQNARIIRVVPRNGREWFSLQVNGVEIESRPAAQIVL